MITLWGPEGSALLVSARIICAEKAIPYGMEKALAPDPTRAATERGKYLFLQAPALRDGGFCLFTAEAIWRYLDDAFPGPALMPRNARARGLASEMLGIIRDYVAEPALATLAVQKLLMPRLGMAIDETRCAEAETVLKDAISVLEQFSLLAHDGEKSEYLIGEDICLADIALMPIFFYLDQFPEGKKMIQSVPRMARWWLALAQRDSLQKLIPDLAKLLPAHE